jgi:hypothetical protein
MKRRSIVLLFSNTIWYSGNHRRGHIEGECADKGSPSGEILSGKGTAGALLVDSLRGNNPCAHSFR